MAKRDIPKRFKVDETQLPDFKISHSLISHYKTLNIRSKSVFSGIPRHFISQTSKMPNDEIITVTTSFIGLKMQS